ncbi:MAG TPA: SDR family NAD(P)-dependent oxidoreductase [Gemmatimonadaceae bacterium]|nr:SDR family NAD(P)-dependent oxidoreductase [Gemmatimonadaceae bacterium]
MMTAQRSTRRSSRGTSTAPTTKHVAPIDDHRFGPWAVVTGASSGIGREFARQIAAAGINVVLVARRQALLDDVGRELSTAYGVEHRVVAADLSQDGFIARLADATRDLDVGLVVSNAGTATPGEFRLLERHDLADLLRLNAFSHMEIAHHFGRRLASRGRGGILLCGAMGAEHGIPYVANDSAAKAYVQSLGESLHVELAPLGVGVTVLIIGPTQTAIIDKFGLAPDAMPMKPMSVEQCASEGLNALRKNRATHLSGRLNRVLRALIPAPLSRLMMGKMMAKALAARGRPVAA